MSKNPCLCYTCIRVNHILCLCSHLKCSPDFTYPSCQGPLCVPSWRFLSTQLFLFLLWSFRAINVCASLLTSWLHPASWGWFPARGLYALSLMRCKLLQGKNCCPVTPALVPSPGHTVRWYLRAEAWSGLIFWAYLSFLYSTCPCMASFPSISVNLILVSVAFAWVEPVTEEMDGEDAGLFLLAMVACGWNPLSLNLLCSFHTNVFVYFTHSIWVRPSPLGWLGMLPPWWCPVSRNLLD